MVDGTFNRSARVLAVTLIAALLSACGVSPQKVTVPVVASVDLPRFMGPWYVIGVIPTFIEKDIYNAIETYELAPDGTIKTTFTFNKGAFDGPAKQMEPKGFVIPGTNNAIWGMQFVWPIKAEYVISHLDAEYTETIIARSARDYVWIMARTPTIDDARYAALVKKVADMGYDISKLVKIPQRAQPAAAPAPAAGAPAMPTPERTTEILASVPAVTPAELQARLAQATGRPVVLDVRRADEFVAGHVEGALNVAHTAVMASPATAVSAAKDAEIVLYCGSGRRASAAIEALRSVGYTNLKHLEGDYPAWKALIAGRTPSP
ncbi:MAG: lipocalin family protein [Steroidobacteraceae bacterium]